MARLVTIPDSKHIDIQQEYYTKPAKINVDPCLDTDPKVPVKVGTAGTEHCPVSWKPPPLRHQHRVREPPLPSHHIHQGEGLVGVGRLNRFAVWP